MIIKSLRLANRIITIFILLQAGAYTRLATRYAPQPNPYTRFGGNYRQGSYCLVTLTCLTFVLLIIGEYCQQIKKNTERLFVDLIRPLCYVYCVGIWLQYAFGLNLIEWNKSDRWCPRWYAHSMYTYPILAITLESFLSRHESRGFCQVVKKSTLAILAFTIWHYAIWACEGRLPNRLFGLIWWKQLLFWSLSSLLHLTLIAIGYFIDWAVYGEPDDDLIDDYDENDKND